MFIAIIVAHYNEFMRFSTDDKDLTLYKIVFDILKRHFESDERKKAKCKLCPNRVIDYIFNDDNKEILKTEMNEEQKQKQHERKNKFKNKFALNTEERDHLKASSNNYRQISDIQLDFDDPSSH